VHHLKVDAYIDLIRPGSVQGSLQKTANYFKRAALQAHGTELPQVACYRIAERKHKPPATTKFFSVLLLATCFGFCEKPS